MLIPFLGLLVHLPALRACLATPSTSTPSNLCTMCKDFGFYRETCPFSEEENKPCYEVVSALNAFTQTTADGCKKATMICPDGFEFLLQLEGDTDAKPRVTTDFKALQASGGLEVICGTDGRTWNILTKPPPTYAPMEFITCFRRCPCGAAKIPTGQNVTTQCDGYVRNNNPTFNGLCGAPTITDDFVPVGGCFPINVNCTGYQAIFVSFEIGTATDDVGTIITGSTIDKGAGFECDGLGTWRYMDTMQTRLVNGIACANKS